MRNKDKANGSKLMFGIETIRADASQILTLLLRAAQQDDERSDLLFRILLYPRAHLNTSRIKRGLGWTTNAWISSIEGPVHPKWIRDCDPFTEL